MVVLPLLEAAGADEAAGAGAEDPDPPPVVEVEVDLLHPAWARPKRAATMADESTAPAIFGCFFMRVAFLVPSFLINFVSENGLPQILDVPADILVGFFVGRSLLLGRAFHG